MSNSTAAASDRREFLTKIAIGSAAAAAGGLALGLGAASARAESVGTGPFSDEWLGKINGKHRQYFDAVSVNDGFAMGYALNFLNAYNEAHRLPDSSLTAVVGLRHFAAPIGFTDAIWAKYKLGEFLKLTDPATKQPLTRNMFNHPNPGELLLPGMSVDKLFERGVIFTVCNVALTVLATATSKSAGVTPEVAIKEWNAGLIPGMNLVPSGVYAVNAAQEKGCTYCAGG